jgi:MarR family transcriptional regulator, organic hydroperoxide resistance regulator
LEELNKGIQIVRTVKQVMDAFKQNVERHWKDLNLTGPQGMLLGTLAHNGEMKISDLSEKLGLSNSTVSGVLDRLEKQGLVERTRSEEDRRVVHVNLTPEFRKNAEQRFKDVERSFEEVVSKASTEELERILIGLETLKKLLDEQQRDTK